MANWMASLKASGKSLDTLEDLFVEELKDIYDAEIQIADALPKMIDAASSPQLKEGFRQHLDVTKRQKMRLEEVFRKIGREIDRTTSDGIKGILSEGAVYAKVDGDPMVKDAALISAIQRVKHYEMAVYGTLRSFATQLGWRDVADLLQQTLNEERDTDRELTQVAEGSVNKQAAA